MIRHSPDITNTRQDKCLQCKYQNINATHFLVAWGRSSSSWVLVWIASVWPVGRVRLPLPRRERTIAVVYFEGVDGGLRRNQSQWSLAGQLGTSLWQVRDKPHRRRPTPFGNTSTVWISATIVLRSNFPCHRLPIVGRNDWPQKYAKCMPECACNVKETDHLFI